MEVTEETCDLESCGICKNSGRDYRGMRWWPKAQLTSAVNRFEQTNAMKRWHTDKKTMEDALDWSGP